MRRYIAMMGVFALLVASLGCQHIGGKCDCGYDPSNAQIQGPTNPYASAPLVKPVPPKGGGNE